MAIRGVFPYQIVLLDADLKATLEGVDNTFVAGCIGKSV